MSFLKNNKFLNFFTLEFENNKRGLEEKKYVSIFFPLESFFFLFTIDLYSRFLEYKSFLLPLIFVLFLIWFGITVLKNLNLYSYQFFVSKNNALKDYNKNKSIMYSLTLHSSSLYTIVGYTLVFFCFFTSMSLINSHVNISMYLGAYILVYLISQTKSILFFTFTSLIIFLGFLVSLKLGIILTSSFLFLVFKYIFIKKYNQILNIYSLRFVFFLQIIFLNFLTFF